MLEFFERDMGGKCADLRRSVCSCYAARLFISLKPPFAAAVMSIADCAVSAEIRPAGNYKSLGLPFKRIHQATEGTSTVDHLIAWIR